MARWLDVADAHRMLSRTICKQIALFDRDDTRMLRCNVVALHDAGGGKVVGESGTSFLSSSEILIHVLNSWKVHIGRTYC